MKTFIGKNLVIYFYPKDSTPGCTTEGQEFRDNYKYFKKLNTEILGVSRDSIKSHENFKSKQAFPFELLSDPDEKVCRAFDVMKLKSMYGREYIGVDRSTFLVSAKGIILKEWRSVKVKGHVDDVVKHIKKVDLNYSKEEGHAFQTAFIKVAIGIEKNTPQKPNILPNINTAKIITTGWSLTVSENIKRYKKISI